MGILINLLLPVLMAGSEAVEVERDYRGAIFPHHLYVREEIEEYYALVGSEEVERIVLVSPNHYGTGFEGIQECVLKMNFESALDNCRAFEGEHGVYMHEEFVAKNFPNAEIWPFIIKEGVKEEDLELLIGELKGVVDEKTFVIASIDFTHIEYEEVALANDNRTIAWIESFVMGEEIDYGEILDLAVSVDGDEEGLAIDSPESFYVFFSLFDGDSEAEFFERTSSNDISGIDDKMLNTSHLFVGVF